MPARLIPSSIKFAPAGALPLGMQASAARRPHILFIAVKNDTLQFLRN